MERKLWNEQQTQKCALTSIGLLIEGLGLYAIVSVGLDRRKMNIQLIANVENQYRAECG